MPKVVFVRWVDSCGRDGWRLRDEASEMKPMDILQVGYLIKDEEDHIVLSQTQLADSDRDDTPYLGPIAIPRVAIKEIREISVDNSPA